MDKRRRRRIDKGREGENDYKMIYDVKNVRIPKYLDLEWFSQQGFNFPNLLEA